MNRESIRIGVCAKWVLGALALTMASVSHASSITLVGGGSTLPAIAYVGYSTTALVDKPASGSLFGVLSAQTSTGVSYCETSDGVALGVFDGGSIIGVSGDSYSVQGTCPTEGFGATTLGQTGLTQPDYVALDEPLGAADYGNYQTGHGTSAYPTQFPAVAATIGIAFNLTDSLGNQVTSSEADFTDAQICGILDGTYTTWNQVTSAFTLSDGGTIPDEPINVQYRSEGTGTTFAFSNHLASICGEINSTYFQASQSFVNVVGNFFSGGLPSNWTGSNGNVAVADAIAATADSFGYVETANTLASNPGLQLADVNSLSPIANFGTELNVGTTAVLYNEVINGNTSTGTPAVSPISSVISGNETAPPTGSQCIVLVQPSFYAKPGVKNGLIPATGIYPIVAVTYLLDNAQGVESTRLSDIQDLVNAPYNSTITGSTTTVGTGTGLALLNVSSGAFSSVAPGDCVNSSE
jgi:phosphate transport system substrate-binding protein